MVRLISAGTAALLLAASGCSAGTSAPPVPAIAAAPSATSAPTVSPTTVPTSTPTVSPTVAPTAVPASFNIINGALLSSSPVVLAARRIQSQGVAPSGLPILVESAGAYVLSAGTQVAWVTNLVNRQDVAETSGSITAPGFAIDSPSFAAQSCTGSLTPWCAAHPLAWTWGTDAVKPVGKQTLTVTFGDGTTAQTADYVYNGWALSCGTGWVYTAGVIVPTATRAASDVYDDCVAGNIVFTHGAIAAANPTSDQFNRFETILPTIMAAISFTSAFVNLPTVSVAQGTVFGIQTTDGGFAKVYFTDATHGLALHSKADGSYAF